MRSFFFFLLFSFALAASARGAEILVVAHKSRAEKLSRGLLEELFSGRKKLVAKNWRADLFDQGADSGLRERFYKSLLDKDEPAMESLWAELVFSGRAKAPTVLANDEAVVKALEANPNGLGYVSDKAKVDKVSVVFRLPVP